MSLSLGMPSLGSDPGALGALRETATYCRKSLESTRYNIDFNFGFVVQ